jgi:ABC-type transporter Mla subunit MlaD
VNTERRDFWTGMFVLGGIATLVGAYVVSFVDRVAQETVSYRIDATEITGVQVGTVVTMGGYPLGTITRVEVTTTPRLAFVLDAGLRPDVPIPQGTRALLTAKLAGGAEIELVPGVPTAAPKGAEVGSGPDLAPLPPGAHLVLESRTDVQDLIDRADVLLRDLQVVAAEARRASEDPAVGLHATLAHVDRVLAEAEATLGTTRGAAGELEGMVERADPALQRSLAQLETTLVASERAVKDMEDVLANADARLDELKGMDAVLAGYDTQKNEDLRESLAQLRSLSASLARLAAAFEKAPLRALRRGAEQEEPALEQGDPVSR